MRTTKTQISLRIRTVWSAPLLSLPRWYNIASFCTRNFKPLASFCGCAGRFESYLVENPVRFSRDEVHMPTAGYLLGLAYIKAELAYNSATHDTVFFLSDIFEIFRKDLRLYSHLSLTREWPSIVARKRIILLKSEQYSGLTQLV